MNKKVINMYFATHKTCNLNCRYCYIPQSERTSKKNDDTRIIDSLEEFIEKVESENYTIGKFCLHGTEPSLLAPESIIDAVKLVNKHWEKNKVENFNVTIQTNGVRFIEDYLKTLEKGLGDRKKLRIGFSIDAPKACHDLFRDNSYDTAYNNFENAMQKGFPVSILSVVTNETMKYLDGFRDWMNLQLGRKAKTGNPYNIKIKFASGEFQLSAQELENFSYFLVENNLLNLVQILNPGYCMRNGNECMWFEFDTEGNCYSCNKSYFEGGGFGNWREESLDLIFEKRKRLFAKNFESPECKECCLENVCNSGCPLDRYKTGEMAGKAHECTLIKTVYGQMEQKGIHIFDILNN
ncbi:MAG: radical SAM protein [FCB group bacterium]